MGGPTTAQTSAATACGGALIDPARRSAGPLPVPRPPSRFPRPHDGDLGLTPQDPAHAAVGTELRVFFLSRADPLVVPLRGRRRGLQLDREPAVRHQRDVAALRDPLLVIPQADQRPRAVTAVAD